MPEFDFFLYFIKPAHIWLTLEYRAILAGAEATGLVFTLRLLFQSHGYSPISS